MALDFPNAPTLNQTFTAPNGVIWVWDGVKWTATTSTSPFTGQGNVGRNLIHNPLFNIAQRGVGPFSSGTGYTLDRWCLSSSLDTNVVTQVAANDAIRAVIGDEAARLLLQFGVTGNAGAGAYSQIYHRIEDLMRLSGKTVTVSFFANASAALKLGVSVDQNFGTGGSPSASMFGNGQAVTLATTFARYSLTFTLPSAAGKTLGSNGDHNTQLCLWLSSGTAQATRAGNIGVQSGTINLWGVQLETGTVATPLEKPDPRYDLANCQRFYQTMGVYSQGYFSGATGIAVSTTLLVGMRALPTLALYTNGSTNVSGIGFGNIGGNAAFVQATAGGSGHTLFVTFTASADL